MYTQGFKIKIPLTFCSILTFGYNVISNILSQKMKYYQLTIYYSINQKCFQFFEDMRPLYVATDTPF